jgi:hypothetical protein
MKSVPELIEEHGETYEKKNEDYGDSWRLVGPALYVMMNQESVVLDSPEDWTRVSLYVRRMDKMIRSLQMEMSDGNEFNYESVMDTHGDESIYAVMAEQFTQSDMPEMSSEE